MAQAVLITGCSSGIGRATAERLAGRGFTVYATARKVASIADLEARGCRVLALDVTDEDSMRGAVETVIAEHGAVHALVNNAGYSQSGAIEEVPIADVRRQFETNVFGLVRMCQLVLPSMRARRAGRIVNVSSMGANFTFPGGGQYHATKYAVEALTDALRMEVKAFGIDVALIEPGVTRSEFVEKTTDSDGMGGESDSPYAAMRVSVSTSNNEAYSNRMMSASAESVAQVVASAVAADRPRTRYLLTPAAKAMAATHAVAGDRVWDRLMARQFSL